jgi:signal transduction histidine kinase
MKFTPQGSVCVNVRFDSELARMDIEVVDTGIGIPADKISNLFQQFSQTDVSNYRNFGGTGLGLAITKTLVELMKGEISVESEVGVGTIFRLYIMLDKRVDEQEKLNESI